MCENFTQQHDFHVQAKNSNFPPKLPIKDSMSFVSHHYCMYSLARKFADIETR